MLAVLPGAYLGFRCCLPAPAEPGAYHCGLAVLPAMVFGAPFGGALFATAAGLVGSVIDDWML